MGAASGRPCGGLSTEPTGVPPPQGRARPFRVRTGTQRPDPHLLRCASAAQERVGALVPQNRRAAYAGELRAPLATAARRHHSEAAWTFCVPAAAGWALWTAGLWPNPL